MTTTDRPQVSQNAAIDKERLRQKYLEERNKRLRPDGNDQYLEIKGQLAPVSYTHLTLPTILRV